MLFRAENNWGIDLWVLRSDERVTNLGGNKYHKLVGYIEAARLTGKEALITMAGAHSNHLRAFAALTAREGLMATALIRGDELADTRRHSEEIKFAIVCGVRCVFLQRSRYRDLREIHTDGERALLVPDVNFAEAVFVPEGGLGPEGLKGVTNWADAAKGFDEIYIACATGTTCAGFLRATQSMDGRGSRATRSRSERGPEVRDAACRVFGIAVLRNSAAIYTAINWLAPGTRERLTLVEDYAARKFGTPYEAHREVHEFCAAHAMVADPLYVGRTLTALIDQARAGKARGRVLFVYTYNE